MTDTSPGDPFEEGWVDDLQDPRARHWQSDNLVYERGPRNGNILNTLLGGGGSGGRGSGSSGGGDAGDSSDGQGGRPFPTALLMVYGMLMAAAGYVWYSLSLAVQEPEVVVQKMDKMLGWGKGILATSSQRLQRLRRQQSIEAHDTGYRPLCVSRDGHLSSSRCVC